VFVARKPRNKDELPAPNGSLTFVDDSFTLPDNNPNARTQAAQRLLARVHDVQRLLAAFNDQDEPALPSHTFVRIQELETLLAAKNRHILALEDLLRRIEAGKMMRVMKIINQVRNRREKR
jgi:predicted metalloendopeptidase